jgi:hypothetical protein
VSCDDYLKMLDEAEPGTPPPAAFVRHAADCPGCGEALRLALMLESAPAWAEKARLPVDMRAHVLAKARMGLLFWRDTTSVLVESVVTALVVVGLTAAAFFGLPSVLKSLMPAQAREIIQSYAAPVLNAVGGFFGSFSPLLHSSMGLALLLGAGFTVLVAAIASTRLLMPSWQA